jgi:hypothetical protein
VPPGSSSRVEQIGYPGPQISNPWSLPITGALCHRSTRSLATMRSRNEPYRSPKTSWQVTSAVLIFSVFQSFSLASRHVERIHDDWRVKSWRLSAILTLLLQECVPNILRLRAVIAERERIRLSDASRDCHRAAIIFGKSLAP